MSCMLRICGDSFNIDKCDDCLPIEPYDVWKKGTPKSKTKKHIKSGISFLVSDADFNDFDTQKSDAIDFLTTNEAAIKQIMMLPGIDIAVLDFGVESKLDAEFKFAQFMHFQAELIMLAGSLGLAIELSVYFASD